MLQKIQEFLGRCANISRDTDQQILMLCLLTLNWLLIYVAINFGYNPSNLSPKTLVDTKNRMVSILHGLTGFFLASYDFFTDGVYNKANTQFQALVCLISLSYFMYDLSACVYYRIADRGLLIHHLLCIVIFGDAVIKGYGGTDVMGGLFLAQISNLPMHLRCLLKNYSLRYTKIYEISQNGYFILYMFARGFYYPLYVFYPSMMADKTPFLVQFLCFGVNVQSYIYIFRMFSIIKKKNKNYQEMAEKNVEFNWFSEHEDAKKLSFYKAANDPHVF